MRELDDLAHGIGITWDSGLHCLCAWNGRTQLFNFSHKNLLAMRRRLPSASFPFLIVHSFTFTVRRLLLEVVIQRRYS